MDQVIVNNERLLAVTCRDCLSAHIDQALTTLLQLKLAQHYFLEKCKRLSSCDIQLIITYNLV